MPLTQEKPTKPLDNNYSNNNDHSYLHKKFKKMASTVSVFSGSTSKGNHSPQMEAGVSQSGSNTFISNGSISAAHPEIEKVKQKYVNDDQERNVQINISNETRIGNIDNFQMPGQTSYTEEYSNKTDSLENELIRETQSSGTSGRLQYVCPYCKLCCAKPSVLQKHIRAHTNERPYPCVPCGFAFKTKSNLYKHRRSRTHALRLLGGEVPASVNDEDSGGSESDTSIPPTSSSDFGYDLKVIRNDIVRPNEFSSPELTNDSIASTNTNVSVNDGKLKTIYKPKFRATSYQDFDDKDHSKKNISSKADFLTEHISKIISDNEAIVDDIDTPLQKKYNKIKQKYNELIAENKQVAIENNDTKSIPSPLNLTKQSNENDNQFRKRSHSESYSQNEHLRNLNPEGSIIKDLLLKANGLQPITSEASDGIGPLYICPQCQIIYRSADNLEVHRLYYCKGTASNIQMTSQKTSRNENNYIRSNSINVRLPESQGSPPMKSSKLNQVRNKPDNLTILKQEPTDVIAPLPSPGPLLGNTRLVDTRSYEYSKKTENQRVRPVISPKRRMDNSSDMYSPRLVENVSPKSDFYLQSKIRFIDSNSIKVRTMDDVSLHARHNSTSLQMFGGEVKIVDHSGGTTTLRIEPSKNQLSPIMIHQSLSPSKLVNDVEASSVVVRSGLHSGGTIVHNPPTPKDTIATSHPQTPRASATPGSAVIKPNLPNTHFQFPPLSEITAYNPLTLPPMTLSPTSSPNGATTILHGGKLIPHVPGIPGPNTPGIYVRSPSPKNISSNDFQKSGNQTTAEFENYSASNIPTNKAVPTKYERLSNLRSPMFRALHVETEKIEKPAEELRYTSPVPTIKIKNVDEPIPPKNLNIVKPIIISTRSESVKRNADGVPKPKFQKELKVKNKDKNVLQISNKHTETKSENEIRHFNFENLITKAEIYNNQIVNPTETDKSTDASTNEPLTPIINERSETSYFQKNVAVKTVQDDRKAKFLRPSTLPLKPGTFTPKRHHGITPNANTMPLVSPETPRPAKAYGQLYLNGNAYTYLGLKCSTKVFYCTINRPQPTYVPNQHFLSMYSNWQLLSELTPDPLGLSASSAMSLYDSRHRPQNATIATLNQDLILTHSSQWNKNLIENKDVKSATDVKKLEDNKVSFESMAKKELAGGFESNEEYTYVRGRGRGRYVCSECGIRCKKPSMLKKHIRTHTDVRPYTCIHCAFSFKTKGNLTKHMKSKAHYKKCCELGINPNEGREPENGEAQCSWETDDDSDSDGDEGNEGETESSDTEVCKSRLPEHEAAHCLLSLGGSRPTTSNSSGLMSARPSTYPYAPSVGDGALEIGSDRSQLSRSSSVDSKLDFDEPMDLSKADIKVNNITEIPTARESSVLASLASNTAKLPQHPAQWANGEPMLHTYLTERALLDSKIKQSQLSYNKKMDMERTMFKDNLVFTNSGGKVNKNIQIEIPKKSTSDAIHSENTSSEISTRRLNCAISPKNENVVNNCSAGSTQSAKIEAERKVIRAPSTSNAENAKQVVSEYLKQAKINLILEDNKVQSQVDNADDNKGLKITIDDGAKEELSHSDSESVKLPSDHESVARKVVVGMGGVAFKVSKGKEFEGSPSFSPNRLMEDGRRVCDFCNKTFTKPSQLRLHLNIHYMERPFRCSVCAVSFRTRGHLQKHERSGSHHNKVSMTSTFGAATSFNPRPFRCPDCNIAFRIHGHLAKHLRSKMHVMRLECLFKLPFGTYTQIEREGVSLTEIDTTDCASSLASLQTLARKLYEMDPTKLEYREPSDASLEGTSSSIKDSVEEESVNVESVNKDVDKDNEKTIESNECVEKESIYL